MRSPVTTRSLWLIVCVSSLPSLEAGDPDPLRVGDSASGMVSPDSELVITPAQRACAEKNFLDSMTILFIKYFLISFFFMLLF